VCARRQCAHRCGLESLHARADACLQSGTRLIRVIRVIRVIRDIRVIKVRQSGTRGVDEAAERV
jgi:hypothetical protein